MLQRAPRLLSFESTHLWWYIIPSIDKNHGPIYCSLGCVKVSPPASLPPTNLPLWINSYSGGLCQLSKFILSIKEQWFSSIITVIWSNFLVLYLFIRVLRSVDSQP
ncbi:hypothetical protein ES288_A01G090300v1 [Gossypium darwinii]|uniref:Uncharacterized protein n=1 Tax=Gossypium darwinii TaxID=34276 RepID=A0A5D2HKE8_GOSDA|nr:hypothetical protein ES288_A01G090300v1 [Gossypium darwinii]